MDADDTAFILASAFEGHAADFSLIGYPLFAASASQARVTMNEHCPFDAAGHWKFGKIPLRAVIGVGTVDPRSGHRIADLYRKRPKGIDVYLKEAAKDLKLLINKVDTHGLQYFGDVVNRYFPSLDFPSELRGSLKVRTKALVELTAGLDALNARIVAAQWRHLRQIKSITAVAGGGFKLHAIWTLLLSGLLNKNKRLLTELQADAVTAQRLLDVLGEYSSSSTEVRLWYEDMIGRLFVD